MDKRTFAEHEYQALVERGAIPWPPKKGMIYQPTNIWGDIIALPDDTTVGTFCDIGCPNIGHGCRIQTGVSIPPGWFIGNNVFIGPGARFANDRHHSIKEHFTPEVGIVEDGACIGMGALILPVHIGKGAIIGAGAVVKDDVPDGETWVGNPAKKK